MRVNHKVGMLPKHCGVQPFTCRTTRPFARARVLALRAPRVVSFVPVGLAAFMLLALLRENLAHPYITVMKSWYALPAMTAMVS